MKSLVLCLCVLGLVGCNTPMRTVMGMPPEEMTWQYDPSGKLVAIEWVESTGFEGLTDTSISRYQWVIGTATDQVETCHYQVGTTGETCAAGLRPHQAPE